jgi:hypothetical protein
LDGGIKLARIPTRDVNAPTRFEKPLSDGATHDAGTSEYECAGHSGEFIAGDSEKDR